MEKSADAFRTISEVAELLETPAHVLRFWESRFPQIKPVKRAGGRRYYRPSDVSLLTGIKRLLHDEGMTIRGVQKILRAQGVRHVAGLSDDVTPEEEALEAAMMARLDAEDGGSRPQEEIEDGQVAALTAALDAPQPAVIVPFPQMPLAEPVAAAPPPMPEAPEEVPPAPMAEDVELLPLESARTTWLHAPSAPTDAAVIPAEPEPDPLPEAATEAALDAAEPAAPRINDIPNRTGWLVDEDDEAAFAPESASAPPQPAPDLPAAELPVSDPASDAPAVAEAAPPALDLAIAAALADDGAAPASKGPALSLTSITRGPVPPAPTPSATESPAPSDAAEDETAPPPANRLRALPVSALAARQEEAAAILTRLKSLRDRLAHPTHGPRS